MILGLSSFTYGWSVGVAGHLPAHPFSAGDLLDRTIGAGLRCLQIGDNLPLHALEPEAQAALRSRLQAAGVRLEIGARGLTDRHLAHYAGLCAFFGAPLLRFVIDDAGYRPSMDTVQRIIENSLPVLQQQGLTLGIENHDRFRARELAGLMERIGSRQAGICLDCANSLGAGEGLEYVSSVLAPYTVNLHLKDIRISRLPHLMGFVVEGAPAGQGMTDFPALLAQAAAYGRCQSAILEQWVPPEADPGATAAKEQDWAMQSLQYLRQLGFHSP